MMKGPGSAYDKWNIAVVFVTHIFHNGQPSHGGDCKTFEVMTSTYPRVNLGSVAALLAATLYQGNSDRNHKLWNIYQMRDIYSICRCCWNVATHKRKLQNGKIEIISFVVKFRS
jgi:hypothetical protein